MRLFANVRDKKKNNEYRVSLAVAFSMLVTVFPYVSADDSKPQRNSFDDTAILIMIAAFLLFCVGVFCASLKEFFYRLVQDINTIAGQPNRARNNIASPQQLELARGTTGAFDVDDFEEFIKLCELLPNNPETKTFLCDLQRFAEIYKCPMSLSIVADPTTLASGLTFEKIWVESWMQRGKTVCPTTKKPLRVNSPNELERNVMMLEGMLHQYSIFKREYARLRQQYPASVEIPSPEPASRLRA